VDRADTVAAMSSTPKVIAHRGVHGTGVTENTIAAFEAALGARAEMIELDVRRTGAGELVILHDHEVGRTAIDSCSLDALEAQTGFRPPLLSEVLEWADGRIGLDVELKEDGYVSELAPQLSAFAARGNELIVTSFLDPVLAQLRELASELALGLLLSWTAEGFADRANACGASLLLPEMKLVDEALVAAVSEAGLELITWDFFATEHADWLSDPRLKGVITDDVPGALRARAALS
jgi:glycerophosphoryl diester phosphodiesterase